MIANLSKKCRKCGEKLSVYECRCYRCRSYDPLVMTLVTGGIIICNAALGAYLAKLFSGI